MSGAIQFEGIWKDACTRYQEIVGINPEGPTFPRPTSLAELKDQLDKRNHEFKSFREKRAKLFRVLASVCKPIENLGEFAASAASTAFPPSSVCFGAISHLIQSSKDISELYDAIIKLFERLQDALTRLQLYSEVEITNALRAKLVEALSVLLRVIAQTTKLVKHRTRGRFEQYVKNIFLGQDPEISGLLTRLDEITASELDIVNAETYVDVKKMSAKLDTNQLNLTERLKSIEVSLTSLQKPERGGTAQDDRESLRQLLKPSSYPADIHDQIQNSLVTGTGSWILEESAFKDWTHGTGPLLWVAGIPGSGKSFLCGRVISYLTETLPSNTDLSKTVIAFFYFQDSEPLTRSFTQALRDMAFQLAQRDPRYAKYLSMHLSTASSLKTIRSHWRRLFYDYFVSDDKERSKAILVLDGIDEGDDDERREFLDALLDVKRTADRLRVALFGRPQVFEELRTAFEGGIPTIYVEENNSADISAYINAKVKRRRGLRPQARDSIIDTLKEKAQGMFMWVDLMIRQVRDIKHEERILEALHHAPRGLDEMLSHVLESFSSRLDEDSATDLNILLKWVAYAMRPLALVDLEALLQIESGLLGERITFEERLRIEFSSFFVLQREDGMTTADLQKGVQRPSLMDIKDVDEEDEDDLVCDSNPHTTTVIFRHASIGDFFRGKGQKVRPATRQGMAIGVDYRRAPVEVLIRCLESICDTTAPSRIRMYAGQHWHAHLRQATDIYNDVSLKEKQVIVTHLAIMFRDEALIGQFCLSQQSAGFFNLDLLKLLRRWSQEPDSRKDLSPESKSWACDVAILSFKAFSSVARVASMAWLREIDWMPSNCLRIIHQITVSGPNTTGSDHFAAQDVLHAAEWAGFQHDALWHRRVAVCLRECKHYNEATEYFKTALQMEERMWLARSGIARIHAKQREYSQAVALEVQNEAIVRKFLGRPTKPTDPDHATIEHLAAVQSRIGHYYRAMRDYETSYEWYMKAFESNQRDFASLLVAANILQYFREPNDWEEWVMTQLKSLDETASGDTQNRLTELLYKFYGFDNSYFWYIADAAKNLGQLKWLQQKYEGTIAASEDTRSPVRIMYLEVGLAELCYLAGDVADAELIWQRLVQTTTRPAALEIADIHQAKRRIAFRYGQICLQGAYEAADPSPYVQQLRNLCIKQHSRDGSILSNFAALYMTIWLRTRGKPDWKDYVRPFIRECIELLSDDDPDNDFDSYRHLLFCLIAAGEESSAIAVAKVIRPQLRHYDFFNVGGPKGRLQDPDLRVETPLARKATFPQSSSSQKQTLDDKSATLEEESAATKRAEKLYPQIAYRWPCICKGFCRKWFPLFNGVNICRFCLTDLCDDCLGKVKAGGELLRATCKADHSWLRVSCPYWEVSARNFMVDGKEMDIDDFKETLRTRWTR